jgi:hypothetical protein
MPEAETCTQDIEGKEARLVQKKLVRGPPATDQAIDNTSVMELPETD